MPDKNNDLFIDFLNRLSYSSSGIGLGSIAGYLIQNKDVIFIILAILAGMVGALTFITSLYFQIKRDRREAALNRAETELVERRLEIQQDNHQRNRITDKK